VNNLTAKNVTLTILQIPALLAKPLIAYLDLLLTRYLAKLANPLSPRCLPASNQTTETMPSISLILNLLSKSDYYTICRFRVVIETQTEAGRRVVKTNPDRHLYAVRFPTKDESLRRIMNVIIGMNPTIRQRVLTNAKTMLSPK